MADSAFAEFWIIGSASGCDHDGRHTLAKQIVCVIEARSKYGRRTPIILRRAENDNRVCTMKLLLVGVVHDIKSEDGEYCNDRRRWRYNPK